MQRVRAVMIGLLLTACGSGSGSEGGRKSQRNSNRPNLPERIAAGSWECEYCVETGDGQGCSYAMRHGCGDVEGLCSSEIPCDPSCCLAPGGEQVGLDQPPWGPILAEIATDQRPPTGAIAYHH